jgi:hypothetical protein
MLKLGGSEILAHRGAPSPSGLGCSLGGFRTQTRLAGTWADAWLRGQLAHTCVIGLGGPSDR